MADTILVGLSPGTIGEAETRRWKVEDDMKKLILPVAAVALLTFCGPRDNSDTAAIGEGEGGAAAANATMDSAMAPAATAEPALDDTGVLAQLDIANNLEIQTGEMAAKKATNPQVKQMAQKIVKEHTANRQQGRALAKKLGTTPSGGELASAADARGGEMDDLNNKTGKEFDQAWVDFQIDAHQKTLGDLQNKLLPAAQNAELKAMIQKTIPKVQEHLTSLEQLKTQVEG